MSEEESVPLPLWLKWPRPRAPNSLISMIFCPKNPLQTGKGIIRLRRRRTDPSLIADKDGSGSGFNDRAGSVEVGAGWAGYRISPRWIAIAEEDVKGFRQFAGRLRLQWPRSCPLWHRPESVAHGIFWASRSSMTHKCACLDRVSLDNVSIFFVERGQGLG